MAQDDVARSPCQGGFASVSRHAADHLDHCRLHVNAKMAPDAFALRVDSLTWAKDGRLEASTLGGMPAV